MNIAVVGTGYVGLVTGTCFAEIGVNVTCIDTDAAKIDKLRSGVIPIYEPGLAEMVARNVEAGRLRFDTDLTRHLGDVEVVFCAVGTPPREDGSADLGYVLEVARTVGRNMDGYLLIVTKSTVPVGTAEKVRGAVRHELEQRGLNIDFDVASNPEFLKEGDAVNDFMKPDRVVVGVDSERARDTMQKLYKPFMMKSYRMIFTDIASAEMIKYASNAMLATRISFMNEIANLCELLGADVNMVRQGVGADSRIGSKFLYPGIGYGGSCFPKDVEALVAMGRQHDYEMKILKSVEDVNERQKTILFDKLVKHFGDKVEGLTVALWGLAFKPETDDMRQAPSLALIRRLTEAGCKVKAYDPVAADQARGIVGDAIEYCDDMYAAAEGADALMLATEWKEFRIPDWDKLKGIMGRPVILDGRNIYDRDEVESKGFAYYKIG